MDVTIGDKIFVTDRWGKKHEAVITEVWGNGGTVNANSKDNRFVSVPYFAAISKRDQERGYYWKLSKDKDKDKKKK